LMNDDICISSCAKKSNTSNSRDTGNLMIDLRPGKTDDPNFVELVSQLLTNLVQLNQPAEVYVVTIDHWFDHKWQHFSGKVIGAVGVWKTRLTVPPFDPGRVVSEAHFHLDPATDGYREEIRKPLHLDQWSVHNLQRFIADISGSGVFVWYSSNTEKGDRASLMVYIVNPEGLFSWYASLVQRDGWKLNKVKGISRAQFEAVIRRR